MNLFSRFAALEPEEKHSQGMLGSHVTSVLLWLIPLPLAAMLVIYLLTGSGFPEPRVFFVLPLLIAAAYFHQKLISKGKITVFQVIVLLLLGLTIPIAFFNGHVLSPFGPIYTLTLIAVYRGRYRLLAPYFYLGLFASAINLGYHPGAYEYQLRIFLISLVMVYPLHLIFEVKRYDELLSSKCLLAVAVAVGLASLATLSERAFNTGFSLKTAAPLPAIVLAVIGTQFISGTVDRLRPIKPILLLCVIVLYAFQVSVNGILPVTGLPLLTLVSFLLLSSFNALMLSLSLILVSILGIFTSAPTDFELLPFAFRLIAAAAIFTLGLKALFGQREIEAGLPTVPPSALLKVLPLSLAATAGVALLLFDGFHFEHSAEFWTGEIDLHRARELVGLCLMMLLFTWGFGAFWQRSYALELSNQSSKKLLDQMELALKAGEVSIYELDLESGDSTLLAGQHPTLPLGDRINIFEYARQVASPSDVDRILQSLTTENADCQFAVLYHPGDKPHWSRIITGTHYQVAGRLKHLYIRTDVTQLQESLAAMRLSNERQRDLFAVIGHELRTPVASVEMIINDEDMSDKEKLSQVLDINHNLLDILNDMRTVVAPERAKSAEVVPGNPSNAVTRALTPLQPLLKGRGFKLELSIDEVLDQSFRYREQALRQLVTNLVKNAALHSAGSAIWIEFSATRDHSDRVTATLSVEDNGRGIPAAELEKVFQAFGRGDTQSEGTGLGLYIAKELGKALGGELSYQSSQHGGAHFSLSFTLDLDQAAQAQAQDRLAGLRVLVAEDDAVLRMLTQKALTKRGATVMLAVDGKKALDAFNEGEFDLVLTDLMMPNMDGESLTRRLREAGATLPIIALTAAVIGEETDRLLEAGVDRVISKPIDLDKLAQLLGELEEPNDEI